MQLFAQILINLRSHKSGILEFFIENSLITGTRN